MKGDQSQEGASTLGHPRESDKKFFDLIRFVVEMRSATKSALIFRTHNSHSRCVVTNKPVPKLVTFTLNDQ